MLRIRTNKKNVRKFAPQFPIRTTAANAELPALLIVDDDEQVLRVAMRLLGRMWNIETAHSACEAARLLERKQFEAILTDFEMPGENGLWLLEVARKYHPFIRRVLFSGSGPSNLSEHVRSGLVHYFIAKPSSREELVASLQWKPKSPPH